MPFGYDGICWQLTREGIDWMIAVVLFVANLPGAGPLRGPRQHRTCRPPWAHAVPPPGTGAGARRAPANPGEDEILEPERGD